MPWRLALLKDKRVLARCDSKGELVAVDSRVEIRYRPNDGRAYRAAVRNLSIIEDAPILPGDACAEAVIVDDRKVKASAKTAVKHTKTLPDEDNHKAALVAYTDGACSGNPGPAGLGVVLESSNGRREFSLYLGRATNNIAELSAIKCALEAIGQTKSEVRIYTDSRYAIGVLSKGWNAKANQALIADIRRSLESFPRLKLIYVPGHSGHPQNERADELARKAISNRASCVSNGQ